MAYNITHDARFIFSFGILGNIVSFLVYLAPLPTFYKIYKRKSTEGFQSIPYAVALFSAMLTLYYGILKEKNGTLIITINAIGTCIESTYLLFFIIYATKEAKAYTTKLLILFNIGCLGMIVISTFLFFVEPKQRLTVVGWIVAIFSVCVFVAPLSIMRLVIRTKSVEYMPFLLSFFLTICSIMWFFYGFLIQDFFVAAPNVLGLIFGLFQMVLYSVYKDRKKHTILPIGKIDDMEMQKQTQQEEQDTKGNDVDEQIHVTEPSNGIDQKTTIVLVPDDELACDKILVYK